MPPRRSSASGISMRPLDELFEPTIPQSSENASPQYPSTLPIHQLHPFPNHPFQVRQDEELYKLAESIKEHGIAEPILCRPDPGGSGYQTVSGHRRIEASKIAGLTEVPVSVRDMDDDQAILIMVDANLHREKILPSEKAFSFKMKVEALNRRRGTDTGLVVSQGRATEVVGEETGENYRNVMRYIRLTFLEKPLLDLVDEGKIKLHPSVELSYLKKAEQIALYGFIRDSGLALSLQQAKQFKSISQNRDLTAARIEDIMIAGREVQVTISFKRDELSGFFPESHSAVQIKASILNMLESRCRNREMER